MLEGLVGLLIFVADIWAIYNVWTSDADTGNEVVWSIVIFLLPLLGLILWYFMGPKSD